ncbi:hypothetical protein NBRC116584_24690 [Hydrogenophaga sp. 5NK40-0174]
MGAGALAAATPLGLFACGGTEEDDSTTYASSSSASGSCSVIPTETAGPYPADGANGQNRSLNALALSGIVRRDIRSSIAGASGTASGVPLSITLTLVDASASCGTLSGLAVYLWHCDAQGRYSLYSSGVTGQNYLRGVQVSDSNGQVQFNSIFPGCYDGRWPHIHFEIYGSLEEATGNSATGDYVKVTQLALPYWACSEVYGTSLYNGSASNLGRISLSSDNVFADDGASMQMASVSGSVSAGMTAALTVAI